MESALQHHWQQLNPAAQPPSHRGSSLVFDKKRQQTVLVANGATWHQSQNISPPSPRQNALLVYDNATQQMLLFGGINAQGTQPTLSDTWVLQNNGWIKISESGAPTAFYESTVYDDATHTVLVYAAQSSTTKEAQSGASMPISQTWIWNGRAWKLLL